MDITEKSFTDRTTMYFKERETKPQIISNGNRLMNDQLSDKLLSTLYLS